MGWLSACSLVVCFSCVVLVFVVGSAGLVTFCCSGLALYLWWVICL